MLKDAGVILRPVLNFSDAGIMLYHSIPNPVLGPGRYSGLFSATPVRFTAVSLQTNVTPAPTSSIRYRREQEITLIKFFALMLAVVLTWDSAYFGDWNARRIRTAQGGSAQEAR